MLFLKKYRLPNPIDTAANIYNKYNEIFSLMLLVIFNFLEIYLVSINSKLAFISLEKRIPDSFISKSFLL